MSETLATAYQTQETNKMKVTHLEQLWPGCQCTRGLRPLRRGLRTDGRWVDGGSAPKDTMRAAFSKVQLLCSKSRAGCDDNLHIIILNNSFKINKSKLIHRTMEVDRGTFL